MNFEKRPIISISLTKFDKLLEFITWSILIGFWVYTFLHYKALPETIPTHFNGLGEIDGYGSKWMIITLPVLTTILTLGLTIMHYYPHKLNYSEEITTQNAKCQYTLVTQMLRVLKLIVVVIFFSIDYKTIQIALGNETNLGNWFLPLVLILTFGTIFYYIIKMSKNK